jgi:hypothetical protein
MSKYSFTASSVKATLGGATVPSLVIVFIFMSFSKGEDTLGDSPLDLFEGVTDRYVTYRAYADEDDR